LARSLQFRAVMNLRTIAISAFTLCISSSALAKEDDEPDRASGPPPAPANAWELTLGNGYSQGFGSADGALGLRDYAKGGFSTQLGFGYRFDPNLMLGIYVEGANYFESGAARDDTDTYGAAAGIQANWHFAPFATFDPWVGLGGGYRGYWLDKPNAGTTAVYGLDLVRVRFGVDYRTSSWMSMGPMVGASLTTFLVKDPDFASDVETVEDREISTFVFVGFQGRFEIGGERIPASRSRVASR
jgi:hypothetical protein